MVKKKPLARCLRIIKLAVVVADRTHEKCNTHDRGGGGGGAQ